MSTQEVYIRNISSGKVLTIKDGSTVSRTSIILYQFHGGASQRWVINADGTISNPQSGKVLDIFEGSTQNGAKIKLDDRHGGTNQKWLVFNRAITNPNTGKVLDIANGDYNNGTEIVLWKNHVGANQQWELVPVITAKEVIIRNPSSGKVLEVKDGSIANDARIVLFDYHGRPNQRWVINEDGTIVNPQSGKVIDCGSNQNGSPLIIYKKYGGDNQRWRVEFRGGANQQWELVPALPQEVIIRNPASGKLLEVKDGSISDDARIVLFDFNGRANQRWVIYEDGTIVNPQSGRAIDCGSNQNGSPLIIFTKHGGDN
eukprot:gene20930-21674_t